MDRSLAVLRNFTEEFSRDIYGGVVSSIELLNEPRLFNNDFSMAQLKSFYSSGASNVSTDSGNVVNTTIHDAFYGPAYWSAYDPSNNNARQPAEHLTLDTHQYYAFAPLNNLSHPEILDSVCTISQLLKQTSSGIPPTVVGEWSLATGSAPNASSSDQDKQDDQARRTWFRLLFESQNAAYSPTGPGQASIGWFYWAWKTEYDIDTWSYRRGVAQGYIPSDVSNASTLVFPVLPNGCVNSSFKYTAPEHAGSANTSVSGSRGLFRLVMAFAALWTLYC